MADGILTPCNVARSWHWFRQVTAPCNVACGSRIMTVNSPSDSILQCDTWRWDDMPLNSPGGNTLQCGRWLWDDVPLNSPKRPPYWNSTSGFWFRPWHRTRHVILHQSGKFYPNRIILSWKVKVKVWTLAIAPLTRVRLVTSSALQSRKWQLIGMSQWCRSALRGHPLPTLTDNWSHGAASRHIIARISHTRPSPRSRSYY